MIIFWFYMFIVGVFLLVTLLVAMLATQDPTSLGRLQIFITIFIFMSGVCAIRLAMLVLKFADVYGK